MTDKQVAVDDDAAFDGETDHGIHELTPDLAYQRLLLVNVMFAGLADGPDTPWVLIDTGIPGSADAIMRSAERRFGKQSKPVAIVMTHGHFDHAGALEELVQTWDVPVYAHELELPYLDGTTSYPPPDPSVGGGMMSTMSRFYPRGPVNVRSHLRALPTDGSVPGMPAWRWIHTPGHTPGQIALWRSSDRLLVAGDAFITTKQESAYAVLTQRPELHGPPMYYTPDWKDAKESVRRLAALEPEMVISGHGPALQGSAMRDALSTLARDFDTVAVPKHQRYSAD